MRKLCRLSSLLFIAGLMILSINVILATMPVPAQATPLDGSHVSSILTAQNSITSQNVVSNIVAMQAIDGLTITYSSPPLAGYPVFFTATITTTTVPTNPPPPGGIIAEAATIVYIWSFGDGSDRLFGDDPVVSHTYALPMTYTVLVTALNSSNVTSATQAISVPVQRPPQLFLPVLFKNFTPPVIPADLTCTLIIEPPNPSAGQPVLVIVDVENEGNGSADGFWIDLYVNPTNPPEPGRTNRISWQNACGGINSCSRGVAWSVSNAPLSAGNSRTFVTIPDVFNPITGQGFDPANSNWENGIFSEGTYQFYAYVDSINGLDDSIDGAVVETNETNNRCQGTLFVPSATLFGNESLGPSNLPKR